MDEVELIKAAQQGDLTAFNRLVLDYQSQVYNVAYRVMGEGPSADDATQEAFISAWRHIKRYRGGSFRAWLLRITTNACYDELRRRKRRPATSLDALPVVNVDPVAEANTRLHTPPEAPDQAVARGEMAEAIQHCLNGLKDDQRVAVVMCDVQGYDYDTIAQSMGVALGTVKSRLARARASLRDCLRGSFGELLPDKLRLKGKGR